MVLIIGVIALAAFTSVYGEDAIELGLAERIFNQGSALFYGYGGTPDREAGCKKFEEAASLGYPDAVFSLGNCLRMGYMGEVDEEKARSLYVEAAGMGVANAFVALGVMRLNASEEQSSIQAANELFEIAMRIEPNNPEANYHFGLSLLFGRGVDRHVERGMDYMHTASDGENDLAIVTVIYLDCLLERIKTSQSELCEQSIESFNSHPTGHRIEKHSYDEIVDYLIGRKWLPDPQN